MNNSLFYVAALWVLRQCGVPHPTVRRVAEVDISVLTPDTVLPVVEDVWDEYVKLGKNDQVAKGVELSKILFDEHKKEAVKAIKSAQLPTGQSSGPATQS